MLELKTPTPGGSGGVHPPGTMVHGKPCEHGSMAIRENRLPMQEKGMGTRMPPTKP